MADITTDVLIIGTGPAGSATAALLSTYGIQNMAINRYRWLANTPRAHITNQRAMEVLRDLGRDVEDEAYLFATHQNLMGENIFCESLAGEEIGRGDEGEAGLGRCAGGGIEGGGRAVDAPAVVGEMEFEGEFARRLGGQAKGHGDALAARVEGFERRS